MERFWCTGFPTADFCYQLFNILKRALQRQRVKVLSCQTTVRLMTPRRIRIFSSQLITFSKIFEGSFYQFLRVDTLAKVLQSIRTLNLFFAGLFLHLLSDFPSILVCALICMGKKGDRRETSLEIWGGSNWLKNYSNAIMFLIGHF